MAGFGPNEWLVEEIYQQYLEDPDSVDNAWHEFFDDYKGKPAREDEAAEGSAEGSSAQGDGAEPATESTSVPAKPPEPLGAAADKKTAAKPSSATNGSAPSTTDAKKAEAKPTQAKPADGESTKAKSTPAESSAAKPAPAEPKTTDDTEGKPEAAEQPVTKPLRGYAAAVAANMATSLQVPTATSVRAVPAKLLVDNRTVINRHLARARGGKVSFTHLIGYAMVCALESRPEMNAAFQEANGKPTLVTPPHVNLGIAIDLPKDDGSRQLVVPSIKGAEAMDFAQFWSAYEDVIRKARNNKLTADDYAGTTISLTNPGTIGTVHSVPRLMAGQGAIIGVGAMEFPAEFAGASAETLSRLAISKTITLTSTYDHRIIQGAQSGDFLRRMHELLLGEDGFYDAVFRALRIPYEPVRWIQDIASSHEDEVGKPARVIELVHAYRVRGHLMADTDPLEFKQRSHPDLDIVNHGLTLWDLDREFPTGGFGGKPVMSLREILGVLRDSYCRTVGIEYMHIQDPAQRKWIQDRVEKPAERPDREEQLHVLERLNAAEAFESFLQTKYVGQKRFSLEGGESVIPLCDAILTAAAADRLDEVVIGMPHRGRLNVLANIVGKSYSQIFREFDGNIDPSTAHGSGDVKYHLGSEGTYTASDGSTVRVSLASNPSHLEAVDPVLEGVVRAKQDIINRGEQGFTVLPLMMHGDAAFAGQGVVAETLNLSQLRGYRTGGTVHVVVNNQVGFTTAPGAARSSEYATDVARMIQAPIFHVNGDDPEACVRVAKLGFEFRQAFKKDVVIDMLCYRRRGHSEVDEPSFTQPLMYDTIDKKRSVRKIFTEALIGRGDITVAEAEQALRNYQEHMEKVFAGTRDASTRPSVEPTMNEPAAKKTTTSITPEVVKAIVNSQLQLPEGFTVHKRLKPQLDKRASMVDDDAIDWSMGETLAFGSLLLQGRPVRLAGQDSRRGTFGQRHAVIVDRQTGAEHTPLAHLSEDQGTFYVYDSLLSEFAAMGFEYGYSVARPEALVLWEAQFGDFANGAQSIVDEFIAAGEAKWGQQSGVTLLLPHGYEGQGPDHSSGRIERYLAMCAEDNMTVAMPSTPASYFHLLRRQALGGSHRPLIVFTPKSMLRLKTATSALADFTGGSFQPVLADPEPPLADDVTRLLLCTGKVFYDLALARRKQEGGDGTAGPTAIVRVEQLAPLPGEEIADALAAYPNAADVVWVQEEPANMGAWPHVALHLSDFLAEGRSLRRVSRRASASPSAGSHGVHDTEQAALVEAAFAPR
ncbi:MAG: multifunctional oxoglutarate decarboxylase/oxoglutarate dehydrogenase thiamine pyrophosphate-binding subunit/dihydrolipoyllysine-residue succinyltransferase subunit [Actinomycetota bacterium]|nr:multifunctional oxoglutarate decarboxylase/oxoglutarate dehydrogenase thiamine pyrophosphate-binding subunit/dihydrolipoyllysine-residue succinyltransferase subunit [Actinomycetota bacterium]